MKTVEGLLEGSEPRIREVGGGTMKALVFHGPGRRSWEDVPKPRITDTTDAIVKISTSTICGTDLHILKGDVPTVTDGRVLGHEGVGIVEEIGKSVSRFRKGDRVLISCITSCGKCDLCKRGIYSHCRSGGWILGNLIDGTQAEYVRIPLADTSLYPLPPNADEESFTMLSDIFPTGFECGVMNGRVKPGDSVAIVGAGPVGLATLLTAKLYSPAEVFVIDLDENRLDVARSFGASHVIQASNSKAIQQVMDLTGGKGVDVAIEAVGIPGTFDVCQSIVAAGGHIANVGVHGKAVELQLQKLWAHNITITTRLVDTVTTPLLLRMVQSGQLQPSRLVTHRFSLRDIMNAYDVFGRAAKARALKVILKNL